MQKKQLQLTNTGNATNGLKLMNYFSWQVINVIVMQLQMSISNALSTQSIQFRDLESQNNG